MSLINEALKKAQRQRVDAPAESTPAAALVGGGPPVPRIAKRRPPMPARTLVLLLVGGGLVLVMGGILTFVLLNLDSKPPVIAQAAPVAHPAAPLSPVVVAAPLPPSAPQVVVVPAPVPVVAVAPAAVESTIPTVTLPRPAPIMPPRPITPPKPAANPAIYPVLEALRISGVRVSGDDSKVIMNDRIVRVNDYIDRALGLRLTKVTPTNLTFTDDAGFEYTKDL